MFLYQESCIYVFYIYNFLMQLLYNLDKYLRSIMIS